eukprot:CAMPEP_0115318726 /NCGR_PEP_ID=MMETSP0270-20121206/79365_1 /TAXON_ID=71861 /ORGANISM="Scrippsiella trochoidea, Strain CCMP3099" /LENGTH=119 /DNA_ID=CAMNT_0002738329 /DNA_START=83 /DNA_END=438 /DNA_ORIENTATION=+
MDKFCYELCPDESYPAHAPWSTLEVWIRLNSLRASEETDRKLQELKSLPDNVCQQPEIARSIDRLEQKWLRECSKPYTVTNYMTLPKPTGPAKTTMMGVEAVLDRLVEGHHLQKLGREG